MKKAWTVGQLRAALVGVADDLPVVVEVETAQQGADHVLGGLFAASTEERCDEVEAFYIAGDEEYL